MKFIVKLFPEITIKSPPVRKRFIKQLRKNIRAVLRRIDENVEVTGNWDFVELATSSDDSVVVAQTRDLLSHITGIAYWQQVKEYNYVDFDEMSENTLEVNRDLLKGKTFRVTCARSGKHDFKSIDVEKYVGGVLNQQTDAVGVKLNNPDVVVKIEIKKNRYFLVTDRGDGLGGYPLGSMDPCLSLISGGFDSTVSSFLTMKRGIRTHFCFFNLGGHAHELAVKEVAYYLWSRFGSSHKASFVTVPFEGVVEEILTKVDNSQMGVILKRMMLRAATQIAKEMHVQALVTGEAIAQVSSQTMTNLAVIDSVTDHLVLRPLVAMDKQDIINISRRIGTEEFVKNIPEYCAVISKNPTTRAKPEKIVHEEGRFDFSVLEEAIATRRKVQMSDIVADDLAREEIDVVDHTEQNDVVIDIRHPEEEEIKPFSLPDQEVLTIPFYQLRSQFTELDTSKNYLLYCDKGVMSQLHAMHLRDEGYENVGVFSPAKKDS